MLSATRVYMVSSLQDLFRVTEDIASKDRARKALEGTPLHAPGRTRACGGVTGGFGSTQMGGVFRGYSCGGSIGGGIGRAFVLPTGGRLR